jgi:hypothetical protein
MFEPGHTILPHGFQTILKSDILVLVFPWHTILPHGFQTILKSDILVLVSIG